MKERIIFLGAAFICSIILAGLLRRYALRMNLLDIPNARSSHSVPTPRGGGLAVVVVFMLFFMVLYVSGVVSSHLLLVILPACLGVSLIGWLDDHFSISPLIRFCVHLVSGMTALYFLGGLPSLPLVNETIDLGAWSYPFVVPALVWCINLNNFMDGIDGIASAEAISVAGGAAAIIWLNGGAASHNITLVLVIAVTAGFLIWNWPPAKIFMGDACSGFLGMLIGLMALVTSLDETAINLWCWVILYGVFVVDSTYTLVRRVISGKQFYKAHRSHAYQILSRQWNSHLKVTILLLAVNICWLFPLAVVSSRYPYYGFLFTVLALAPILLAVIMLEAGTKDS